MGTPVDPAPVEPAPHSSRSSVEEWLKLGIAVSKRPALFTPNGTMHETLAYLQGLLDGMFPLRLTPDDPTRIRTHLRRWLGGVRGKDGWNELLLARLVAHRDWQAALRHTLEAFGREVYDLELEPPNFGGRERAGPDSY